MKKEEILTNYLSDRICETCSYYSDTFEKCRSKNKKVKNNTCKKWKETNYVDKLNLRELNRLFDLIIDKMKKEEEEKNENIVYCSSINCSSGSTSKSSDETNHEKD